MTLPGAGGALLERHRAEVQIKLAALLAALDQHADKLSDPKAARWLVERVIGELKQPQPDRLALKGFLTLMIDETKAVAAIAAAATALKNLAGGLS